MMTERPAATGTLRLVATPIGNMEDITLRALRVLGQAPLIAAEDTRSAQHLLVRHGLWPRPAGEGRVVSFFEGNEVERGEQLLAALREGTDVAVISDAGMPGISDPGQRLVARAVLSGLPVEVIPGPCAAVMALTGSGLPTDRFLFVGFPPRTQGARQELFGSLRGEPGTLILYEAPDRTATTLSDLAAALGPERPACVARELTKLYEEFARGTLAELFARYCDTAPRGEVTLLVGGNTGPAEAALDLPGIEAAVRKRLLEGQGPKEIAAALALHTGRPRRQLYQLALSLRKE